MGVNTSTQVGTIVSTVMLSIDGRSTFRDWLNLIQPMQYYDARQPCQVNIMLEKYNEYVHNMWVENCSERDSYGESILNKVQYQELNKDFLQDSFCLHMYGQNFNKDKYYEWV